MYNSLDDAIFEGLLSAAFKEYTVNEYNDYPSDEEIKEMYPTSEKMLKKFRRRAAALSRKVPAHIFYLKRVAVVFLVLTSICFGILMTSAEVRGAIADTVVSWYEKYVKFDFSALPNDTESESGEEPVPTPEMEDLQIHYIPEGFELVSSSENESKREYMYMSADGDYMMISIRKSSYTSLFSDIEINKYTAFDINNNKLYLLYNEAERTGSLITGNYNYAILITSISSKENLIDVAINIK